MEHRDWVPIGAVRDLTACRRLFLEPRAAKHRQYEALRAFFVEGRSSTEVARTFGCTPGSRHSARNRIVAMRKQNHSVYEISEALKEGGYRLSPSAVRQVLEEEGFAPLPRRLDEERVGPRVSVEPTADVRTFAVRPGRFETASGGLFLFVPDLVRLDVDAMARSARFPGSKMIPATHALRSYLALKLWSIERNSHVMSLVADRGLAPFAGLNCIPKKSYRSEYPVREKRPKRSSASSPALVGRRHPPSEGRPALVDDLNAPRAARSVDEPTQFGSGISGPRPPPGGRAASSASSFHLASRRQNRLGRGGP
jgi:hypothetical protein